jgi:hypothetical protein
MTIGDHSTEILRGIFRNEWHRLLPWRRARSVPGQVLFLLPGSLNRVPAAPERRARIAGAGVPWHRGRRTEAALGSPRADATGADGRGVGPGATGTGVAEVDCAGDPRANHAIPASRRSLIAGHGPEAEAERHGCKLSGLPRIETSPDVPASNTTTAPVMSIAKGRGRHIRLSLYSSAPTTVGMPRRPVTSVPDVGERQAGRFLHAST